MHSLPTTSIAIFVCLCSQALSVRAADPDFSRDVRPILARHCFKCHGPDDKARKAALRLDRRDTALRGGKSGEPAIVPGKPDAGELNRRISSTDDSEIMPPPATKNPLSDHEKQLLRRWISAGAEYKQHWAFLPPREIPLPKVKQADWPRNAIDYWVLARMESAGLHPSPQASPATLVRRLYLDLIGLPPTPEEVDAFVNNPSPEAYAKQVDSLLASPHYGERWARRWLDLARYADTNGYEKDRVRSIWPYRDWVIQALNQDMPFDQFTIEQIAGDMLPNATLPQRIATGFHRNTMLNEEGGIDPLEFRFHAMTDRVATTGTVWLGLTVGCAQCHTHKFDPIPQREYYQFMACLNNADELTIDVPKPDLAKRRAELQAQIKPIRDDLPNRFPVPETKSGKDTDRRPLEVRRREHLQHNFDEWLKQQSARAVKWTVLRPSEAKANLPLLHVLDDNSVLASSDQTKRDVYDLKYRTDLRGITAVRLEVLPHESLPKGGPGRVYYEGAFGDFFLSELTLSADGRPVKFKGASSSFHAGNNKIALAIDGDPRTGWSINGGQGKAHAAVLNLAAPLSALKELALQMVFEQYYASALGRFRISVTTDPRKVEASALPAEIEDLVLIPAERRTEQQREQLFRYYLSVAPELAREHESIRKLQAPMPAYPTTLVLAERPATETRPTHVHNRGEFLKPTERVDPGVLSILPALPKDAPRNRLTFARWLVDPRNPLVGRVTMNRQWAALFGKGIVRTTEDFGYQGDPPTHQELLDWLAIEFIRRGWSMKQMHRLIVTSATYQQSSQATPELLKQDPENRLLARGPRVRLEAELVRDVALQASGLLAPKVGGPSVFPPQPPGVSTEGAYGALAWNVSPGEDRYRRGLYTFCKRTAPFAMFNAFDAPSGEACVARREVSNTPLQALTLLNDTVFVEAAQSLGRSAATQPGSIETRAAWLFRRCVARGPDEQELRLLVDFYETEKRRFVAKELNPAALAGPGGGDACDRAAWTALARAVLNLDETIMKN
jgi:Protein of unknown function (DUF1553)/Protein of unknown function (DUF1549)/Planctomycete cytochrome C